MPRPGLGPAPASAWGAWAPVCTEPACAAVHRPSFSLPGLYSAPVWTGATSLLCATAPPGIRCWPGWLERLFLIILLIATPLQVARRQPLGSLPLILPFTQLLRSPLKAGRPATIWSRPWGHFLSSWGEPQSARPLYLLGTPGELSAPCRAWAGPLESPPPLLAARHPTFRKAAVHLWSEPQASASDLPPLHPASFFSGFASFCSEGNILQGVPPRLACSVGHYVQKNLCGTSLPRYLLNFGLQF